MISPGNPIGVLGGGQLGMFFVISAKRMGYRVSVWDPDTNAPARNWADTFICADFKDPQAFQTFSKSAKGITYEWENIPGDLVERLEKEITVRPGSRALNLLQNRVRQKRFLQDQGLPVPPFHAFEDPKALPGLAKDLGLPCIVKTATAGYDGLGQWNLEQADQVASLPSLLQNQLHPTGWIIEKRIPYVKELGILVVHRGPGTIQTYPISENWHENGILRMSQVPAEIDQDLTSGITSLASGAVAALGEPGVFCVEMFLMGSGEILINEIAPRPHNSGHYTMDVCPISQFEQQVRVVCGLPIDKPRLLSPAVLVNILGSEIQAIETGGGLRGLLTHPGIRFYHYRKKVIRPGRKMGHILVVDQDAGKAMEGARQVRAILSSR